MQTIPNNCQRNGCENYNQESYTNFLLSETEANSIIKLNYEEFNHLVVILEGRVLIEYDDFVNTEFAGGEIVFLPAFSKSFIKTIENSKVLIGTFELPNDVCNSKIMESLWELKSKTEYEFASIPVRKELKQYLDLLVMYLESGIQCDRLHEIKEKEIFLLLRWFYTDEEFVRLFYLMIGKSLDFRTTVIKNYSKTKSIAELAEAVGMSRSNFDVKFREVFGMPPKQWILQKKAKSVRYYMSKPNVSVKDVMYKFDFDSFTHFNRFCKQQFGSSPSDMIKANGSK